MHHHTALQDSDHQAIPFNTSIKGRARIHIHSIYRDTLWAWWLHQKLESTKGITNATINPHTGNALVLFKPKLINLRQIIDSIELIIEQGRPTPELLNSARNSSSLRSWHTLKASTVAKTLHSSQELGLTRKQVAKNKKKYGPNRIPEPRRPSDLKLFLDQLSNVPSFLLLGSAGLSFATGGIADSIVIAAVLLINSGIGFRMEVSATKIIHLLLKQERQTTEAIRSGKKILIDPEQLVPGDLIILNPGKIIPADARVIKSEHLSVDESILTGESLPVEKYTKSLPIKRLAIADRSNMIFKGCTVTSGWGIALVVATGTQTEIGKIQKLMSESSQPETPMQKQLTHLGNQAAVLSIGVSLLVFLMGMTRRKAFIENLRTAVSLAVAAIPESLPTIATSTLARGVKTLKNKEVIIRHIEAVETLASVTDVCFDKTGTLTLNQMEVTTISTAREHIQFKSGAFRHNGKRIVPGAHKIFRKLSEVALLCSEAKYTEVTSDSPDHTGLGTVFSGSSTESALLRMVAASDIDIKSERKKHPLISIRYRTESQNYMMTLHQDTKHGQIEAMKGAPAEVLELCNHVQINNRVVPLSRSMRSHFLSDSETMGKVGLRVLGFAIGYPEKRRVWLGLVGMSDIVRPEVAEVVSLLHAAGIETSMITGDQKQTAEAIGRQIGVKTIYSRVSPSQKLRIIQKMQNRKKVVAMIGDGINDGPALKASDVGIAMAASGAKAAWESADIVLPSDNLHGLIYAIREGRTVHEETKKAVKYILSQNLSEILFTLYSVIFGRGESFSPMQFLWINLVTDIFPELALSQEPPASDVMSKGPDSFLTKFIRKREIGYSTLHSIVLSGVTYGSYLYGQRIYRSERRAKALALLTLTASSLFYTRHARSERITIFDHERLAKNKLIPISIGAGFLAELAGTRIPGLNQSLSLENVTSRDYFISTVSGLSSLLFLEALRFTNNKLSINTKGAIYENR